METIELNGKKYVSLEEYEKMKKEGVIKQGFINLEQNPMVTDACKVFGMGSVELSGTYATTRVSIEYLQKALNAFKAFDRNLEAVDMAVGQDFPLVIGDRKGNKMAGVIIAPKIKEE